jgi:hypothetical protein
LFNVNIVIPLPGHSPPKVGECDGSYTVDASRKCLIWKIPMIDSSNSSGMIEFAVSSEDVDGLFPIRATFSSKSLFCELQVLN